MHKQIERNGGQWFATLTAVSRATVLPTMIAFGKLWLLRKLWYASRSYDVPLAQFKFTLSQSYHNFCIAKS